MSENIDNEAGKTFTAQKPMTNPTADAAKLLPSGCSVPGCPATGDGKPYAGVPTCMRGYAGDPAAYENYIRGCILRANTRKAYTG